MQKPLTERCLENIALFYLARFETSTGKLRQVLKRRVQRQKMQGIDIDPNISQWIENVVRKMCAQGYINDERYVESCVRRWSELGKSHQVIRQKLLAEGMSEDMFSQYLSAQDEIEIARRFVQKKHLGKDYQKDLAKMARAGFSYEVAKEVLPKGEEDV